jgi:hypothetical protein
MLVGDPLTFAVESEISRRYEEPSLMALGYFLIHVNGRCYGVKSPGATMLANSFDAVGGRIAMRGTHKAPFATADALQLADAYSRAIYIESRDDELFLGMPEAQFKKAIYSGQLIWAPDGDEAFDDGSHVLQFDADDRVRLVAFKRPDWLPDPASVSEIWLAANDFYSALEQWREGFQNQLSMLPHDSCR